APFSPAPQPDAAAEARRRDEQITTRREYNCSDFIETGVGKFRLPDRKRAVQSPDPNAIIEARSCHAVARRRERDRYHLSFVSVEDGNVVQRNRCRSAFGRRDFEVGPTGGGGWRPCGGPERRGWGGGPGAGGGFLSTGAAPGRAWVAAPPPPSTACRVPRR